MENKQKILNALYDALKLTRDGDVYKKIEYDKSGGMEHAIVHYKDGYKQGINISCDSGIAMILDVVKNLI